MDAELKTLGLIPARGGSKGVPKKNIRELGGKPLIAHTIEAALKCQSLDRIVVSTDDPEIADVARSCGAEVPFMRPGELATDAASTIPVIVHAAETLAADGYRFDSVATIQTTSPFATSELLSRACTKFQESKADTLVALEEVHHHPFWLKTIAQEFVFPFIQFPGIATRRQDLPPLYCVNGLVYITSYDMLMKKKGQEASYATQIEGERVTALVLQGHERFEIDTEHDLQLAEAILSIERGTE